MTRLLRAVVIVGSGCLVLGCSMPNFQRIQHNMDMMTYYMGVMTSNMPYMAYSTGRMADTAERMERKSNGLIKNLEGKGPEIERTIQNYSQSFLDNDRAVIKHLKEIRMELGELTKTLKSPQPKLEGKDYDRVNAALQARLNDLDTRLNSILQQMGKAGQSQPMPPR